MRPSSIFTKPVRYIRTTLELVLVTSLITLSTNAFADIASDLIAAGISTKSKQDEQLTKQEEQISVEKDIKTATQGTRASLTTNHKNYTEFELNPDDFLLEDITEFTEGDTSKNVVKNLKDYTDKHKGKATQLKNKIIFLRGQLEAAKGIELATSQLQTTINHLQVLLEKNAETLEIAKTKAQIKEKEIQANFKASNRGRYITAPATTAPPAFSGFNNVFSLDKKNP